MKSLLRSLLVAALVVSPACSKKSADSGAGSAEKVEVPPYNVPADTPAPIKAAVTASDRTDKDRALDAGRKPAETFTFFKLAPGQKIGELFAGGGYSTELMARIVGKDGKVYAQNSKEINDKFARKPFEARMSQAVMAPVQALEQPPESAWPATDLDAVITIINYHDFVWQKVDTAKVNKAAFDALKPGGIYGIIDSSAVAGSGARDTETLHRIDEDLVKKEVLAAGFKLDAEADFLRNPADKRDWNSSPKAATEAGKRGTSDRFVLRFVKP